MDTLSLGRDELHAFYLPYLQHVPSGDWRAEYERRNTYGLEEWEELATLGMEQSYAPGKWTPRELLQHLIDVERVMVYRATAISRGETQEMIGFDHESWSQACLPAAWPQLLTEWRNLRASTAAFFSGIDPQGEKKTGRAGQRVFSVRALALIVLGHELHHLEVLRTRYLPAAKA